MEGSGGFHVVFTASVVLDTFDKASLIEKRLQWAPRSTWGTFKLGSTDYFVLVFTVLLCCKCALFEYSMAS